MLYGCLSNSSNQVFEKLFQITGHPTPFVKGDVRETELLKVTLASREIDAVFIFWGEGCGRVGSEAGRVLRHQTAKHHQPVAGHAASVGRGLVFSGATTPCGRNKLRIEEILCYVLASGIDLHVACLRYFNLVGAYESALIGESQNFLPNNHLPYIAQVAVSCCHRRRPPVSGHRAVA